jgi:glutathione synthase
MSIQLGVIMDPLSTINIKKDSTLAMLQEAQQRQWNIFYMQQQDIFVENGVCMADMHPLQIDLNQSSWFTMQEPITQPLAKLDVVLMRKDPPFDMEYIYTTYLLELAEAAGTLIINKPQSLRDANEKIFTSLFPQCCPQSLISRNIKQLRAFVEKQHDVIIKPLGGMGGYRIFRTQADDSNLSVILETMTEYGQQFCMAQQFIPEITYGDKRVLVIDGEPVPYALARIPKTGEIRGNLAAGARAEVIPLGARERWICEQVGPTLREKGLMFVGLDIIGDYLTEINVTSPTCIREIEAASDVKISKLLFDKISEKLVNK